MTSYIHSISRMLLAAKFMFSMINLSNNIYIVTHLHAYIGRSSIFQLIFYKDTTILDSEI